MFSFSVQATCGQARAGLLKTPHGEIATPVFMPVGTRASIKGLDPRELEELDAGIVLANTYHLVQRPGESLIASLGGLHEFMAWKGAILTDSGGYQVHSLADLRSLSDEGVVFRSHLDGARINMTPETTVAAQEALGADIIMPLDVCAPWPADDAQLSESVRLTELWAARSKRAQLCGDRQALFGIVQGGTDSKQRRRSLEGIAALDFAGHAIGGLSVGEPQQAMMEVTAECCGLLPAHKPRYLMGVGTPEDLALAVARGVDMFDTVLPTRNARNGQVFTSEGRLNMRNRRFREDPGPLDPNCGCATCRRFSRAYLRHLVTVGEMLGAVLLTRHNLAFYLDMMRRLRQSILHDRLDSLIAEIVSRPG